MNASTAPELGPRSCRACRATDHSRQVSVPRVQVGANQNEGSCLVTEWFRAAWATYSNAASALGPSPYSHEIRERLERFDWVDEVATRSGASVVHHPAVTVDSAESAADEEGLWRPWILSRLALDAAPAERTRYVSAAIEAFETTVDQPRDPGNDNGPFSSIARFMNLSQARVALQICEQMEVSGWEFVDGSRAHIAVQLAAHGDFAGADAARAPLVSRPNGTGRYFHGVAGGGIAAHRCLHGKMWTLPTALSYGVARGLVEATDSVNPPPALLSACLARVGGQAGDFDLASLSLLMHNWAQATTPEPWLAASAAFGPTAELAHYLFELAARFPMSSVAPLIADEAVATTKQLLHASPTEWLDPLYEIRQLVDPAEGRALWARVCAHMAGSAESPALRNLFYASNLGPYLAWLCGRGTPTEVAKVLRRDLDIVPMDVVDGA